MKTGIYEIAVFTNSGGWSGMSTEHFGYYRNPENAKAAVIEYLEKHLSVSTTFEPSPFSEYQTWEELKENILTYNRYFRAWGRDVLVRVEEIETKD